MEPATYSAPQHPSKPLTLWRVEFTRGYYLVVAPTAAAAVRKAEGFHRGSFCVWVARFVPAPPPFIEGTEASRARHEKGAVLRDTLADHQLEHADHSPRTEDT